VLGPKLKSELFGDRNALGSWVRISGRRLRVIGVMEPKGQILGFDMDDCAYVPVALAMGMFNLDELNEIDVAFTHESLTDSVVRDITSVLRERHDDNEDFTILTQAAMLEVFDDVMNVVTSGVAAIAAVSLLVGAVGILTVMWISVGERRQEIGLVRALGATVAHVRRLFLVESIALALIGGVTGLLGGLALAYLLGVLVPDLPVNTPLAFIVAALVASSVTGIASGLAPARRAALLDPVEALRDE
jgi:putative ABC transport system permease protein